MSRESSRFKPFPRFSAYVVSSFVECNIEVTQSTPEHGIRDTIHWREIMRLTDEMKIEINMMADRVDRLDTLKSRLNFQYGSELESYKVKLENFYSETDLKEQTFQHFQICFSEFAKKQK